MENVIGVLVAVASGMVCLTIGLPLAFNKIPPNRLYGFRVSATLNDPKIWHPVNEHSGRWLVGTGVALFALSTVGAFALNDPVQQRLLLVLTILVIGFGISTCVTGGFKLVKTIQSDLAGARQAEGD